MSSLFQISEHEKLPDELTPNTFNESWKGGLCLNPNATDFDKRYLFVWDKPFCGNEWNYHATYTIGVWWLSDAEDMALSVTTDKFEKVDFMKMFSVCLESGLDASNFSKIYGIKLDSKPIKISKWDSVISPLIITHFIIVLKELVAKGLKKNYVYEESNLRTLKGKLQVYPNQNLNVNPRRLDRFYCKHQEHTVDIPENRLLKKALLFAERVLLRISNTSTYTKLHHTVQQCKTAFSGVSDNIDVYMVRHIKANKLFKEYGEALKLAKIILKHYDFSITKAESEQDEVLPFWIDMPLLYEHYVYGLLKQAYGDKIVYQCKGITGRPDFLYVDDEHPMILDTKYINMAEKDTSSIDNGIIRQLGGYARDLEIRKILGVEDTKIIPCVYIYPSIDENTISSFKEVKIWHESKKLSKLLEFYKIGIHLPMI